MMEKEGKNRVFVGQGVGHGRATIGTSRATTGTGRAKLLVFGLLQGLGWHGRAPASTGRAKLLALWGSKFFFSVFLNRSRTITYKIT